MKKLFTILFFISGVVQVKAIYFSEIMYDTQGSDTSREWVEIYNDTGVAIDIPSWKFFENGINHGIVSYSGGTSLLAEGYAVIADNPVKFLEDNSSYQGVLYDSSFLLSNTGEHLALKMSSSGLEIASVDYDTTLGGSNDGSTLSKIDGVWVRGVSTPGSVNQLSLLSSATSTSTTTESQSSIAQMSPPTADIILYMPFEKTVIAGADVEFATAGMTRAGKNIDGLVCTWAFGDGGQGVGTSTKYRYAYPGRYIAQVEGTNGHVAGLGRMNVRVVPPDIIVTKIATGKYGLYVDIFNPNSYDLDLSQWKLSLDGAGFPFPKNTVLGGNSTTRFSGLAMGFASTTIASSTVVRILFPNQEEVVRYTQDPETIHSGIVLGTTSTSITPKTKVASRPILKASSAVISVETGTTTKSLATVSHKDTRIVAFFKSLLWK